MGDNESQRNPFRSQVGNNRTQTPNVTCVSLCGRPSAVLQNHSLHLVPQEKAISLPCPGLRVHGRERLSRVSDCRRRGDGWWPQSVLSRHVRSAETRVSELNYFILFPLPQKLPGGIALRPTRFARPFRTLTSPMPTQPSCLLEEALQKGKVRDSESYPEPEGGAECRSSHTH